jgi:hypothetical protein
MDFGQCEIIRPLSEKFGIAYCFDDEHPEIMDAFELALLQEKAEQKAKEKQAARQKELARNEQLQAIGRERLEAIIPVDAKAVIIAELHEDESDAMSDYYGYNTRRTLILGFSTHTGDMFSELRKYASNFEETSHLSKENEKYEQREKYTAGAAYYLGESKYSGWIVKKEKYYKDRESMIKGFALVAGDEANICVKVQEATNDTPDTPDRLTGDFIIANYSEKALAVFGDTSL